MATKAHQLSISNLADVLAALTEVTKPYQLGIQLKVDLAELDTIEKNHPGNVGRQKTAVIEYWLRNSPDASWTTLASAVERMGGHARLAETLRSKEQRSEEEMETTIAMLDERLRRTRIHRSMSTDNGINSEDDDEPSGQHSAKPFKCLLRSEVSWCSPPLSTSVVKYGRVCSRNHGSGGICRETCESRNILLLGKVGHCKSTLGNKILNYDGCFKINNRACPQMCQGSALLWSASQHKNYEVKLYDHDGLFEGAISVDALSSEIPQCLNLVIFVLKRGRSFDVHEREILETIISKQKLSQVSALVLSHCEDLSEEEREEMIEQFKRDHQSVAELMGKVILAVGFPDSSHIQPRSELSQRVEDDKKKLKQLIYSCDEVAHEPIWLFE